MEVLAMLLESVQRNLQQAQQMECQCEAMWLLFAQA
jgi:hypothetical protein